MISLPFPPWYRGAVCCMWGSGICLLSYHMLSLVFLCSTHAKKGWQSRALRESINTHCTTVPLLFQFLGERSNDWPPGRGGKDEDQIFDIIALYHHHASSSSPVSSSVFSFS